MIVITRDRFGGGGGAGDHPKEGMIKNRKVTHIRCRRRREF